MQDIHENADIPDVYYIQSVDQLKALAEPMRYRMCLLLQRPTSCAALARSLGITRPKAHYHLKKLESVELVRPTSEALVNGIVEKYYIIVGRMLDFSHLLPNVDSDLPDNVSVDMVSAISDYLASMLVVSRENALDASENHARGKGYFFDFDSVLTPVQFEQIKTTLMDLKDEVLRLSTANLTRQDADADLIPFHLSSYISAKKDT
ncbi:hypothetical protein ROLI_014480 [Roseobacter fucihabitans]|uniref:HTH arsR-type domain-containing protein n=1 Tax=Roseobacter fucihabitans TaxID=1537242 RepID=A0ABZ2BSH2_9RHOB|nr:helix-turn-helix domain-containing protein [Roseobacter litoralis]MBC6968216.1 Helix-turn-helix domain protein [Roseobacter litoralis]